MSAYTIYHLDKDSPLFQLFGKRYSVLWNDEYIQSFRTKREAEADIRWRKKRKAEIAARRAKPEVMPAPDTPPQLMRNTLMSALDLIASRITAHLTRFEHDPKINPTRPDRGNTRAYYYAQAWRAGSRVMVRYVSYQGECGLRKEEAERYLAWLDAGNIGAHWKALKP